MDERGEITDEDRRRAAALSGLPEAAVYGISTFYDDLVQPRGRRHVSVCTGTACWASDFGAHVAAVGEALGLAPGERSDDGERSLAATVCLGFCHTARRRPRGRSGRRRRRASVERVARGRVRARRPSPRARACSTSPCCWRPATSTACAARSAELTPEQLLEEVKAANVRGRGGAGFPAGTKWEFAAARRRTPTT